MADTNARTDDTRGRLPLVESGDQRPASATPRRGHSSGLLQGEEVVEGAVDTGANLDRAGRSGRGRSATERRDVQGGSGRDGDERGARVAVGAADTAQRVDVADRAKSPAADEAAAGQAPLLRASLDPGASIHMRVWRVAQEFGAITKDGKMAQEAGGYGFTTIDAILARARTLFDRHGILTVPRVVAHSQDGNRTVLGIEVDFVNVDEPTDKITVPSLGYGNDKTDKGPPKAHTQAIKNAIKALLNLTTKEDEDASGAQTPEHERDTDSAKVAAAEDRARDAVHKWASSYKAAITNARTTSELEQIKRANGAQLKDEALPDVTFTFLDDLYRNRYAELENAEAAQ